MSRYTARFVTFLALFQLVAGLTVRPLSPFGAEITDVTNLDEAFGQIEKVLLEHKVVAVRNQADLTVEGLRAFTRHFGELHVHLESASHLDGYTDVNVVSNIRNAEGSFIGLYGKHVENYHSDLSWAHLPTKITILKSVVRPTECGETHFVDSTAAYSQLNSTLKSKVDNLRANYCYLKTRDLQDESGLTAEQVLEAQNCANHPIINTHPVTKRRNIYANPSHTSSIIGMDRKESDAVLAALHEHTQQERFVYAHHWQDHDLVLWDNRAMQHRATGCAEEYPRMLIRTTVLNDEPPV